MHEITCRKEIFRPTCNPGFESLHCIAHLDRNIGEVLPCLNTTLGGTRYVADPPSLTLQLHGKLISIHGTRIAVNALRDEEEADRILGWLMEEIRQAWQNREAIEPSFDSPPRPQALEVLRRLPRTNCRACRQPTCTVFATLVAAGATGPADCPELEEGARRELEGYLAAFKRP